MTHPSRRCFIVATAAGLASGIATASADAAWPARPIRLVVPFPPGGGADTLGRQIAARLTAQRGWAIVVDNRPGAGGNLGLELVAKAKPDGYTLAMGQTANLAINPTLYSRLPFDAAADFTPVSLVASQPLVFIVRADAPPRSLAELLTAARSRPGLVTMASAGNGTAGHLSGEALAREADVRFSHVPYRGFSQAMNDLLGGQVEFLATSPQSCISQLRSGKVRALAVSSAKRMAIFPDVPTTAEAGYPAVDGADWKALLGPAGLPDQVVRTLHAEMQAALAAPETVERLASEGAEPMVSSPESTRAFILREQKRWGDVVRHSGAKAD